MSRNQGSNIDDIENNETADDSEDMQIKENEETESTCAGNGECFQQVELYLYKQKKCDHGCTLLKCPKCDLDMPQWVLDCNNNFCINCAVELHSLCHTLRLQNVYREYMHQMAKLYNTKKLYDMAS